MAGWKRGDIYVDMSTNSPGTIRQIALDAGARGVTVLDAPVTGGTEGAEQGTLVLRAIGCLSKYQACAILMHAVEEIPHGNIAV